MKDPHEFFLQWGAEIDEQITANQQIKMGKWRIFRQILPGEDAHSRMPRLIL